MSEDTSNPPSFIVTLRVKEYINSQGVHSTADVIHTLNAEIVSILDKAITRCKENRRSTVQSRDI